MRIGFGYDIHHLKTGLPLMLGGVKIPHAKGFVAHSDGDVLLHAVIDALLGAAGFPDIGEQFPDTDKKYKGISSLKLLEITLTLVRRGGFRISNVDATVIAEEPKLSKHKDRIRATIATHLRIEKSRVSVKAKTNEKLGPIGSGRAIAAFAAVLLEEK